MGPGTRVGGLIGRIPLLFPPDDYKEQVGPTPETVGSIESPLVLPLSVVQFSFKFL